MASLKRDGITLFFEEAKGLKRPILFVHGWCCDHSFFAPQFEHFAHEGHHVVAVDLRGHGQSDKPHEDYTMQLFADDLDRNLHSFSSRIVPQWWASASRASNHRSSQLAEMR